MNRDELLALREKILLGDPPYTLNHYGDRVRQRGAPGLEERKKLSDYDVSAAGVRLCLDVLLQLTQHLLDRVKK